MRMVTLTTMVALALTVAACNKEDAANNASADANLAGDAAVSDVLGMNQAGIEAAVTPMGTVAFVNAVAASDLFEIESARLAATKAGSAEVKAFAQKLTVDHAKSSSDLKAAAARVSPPVTVTPTLDAEQQRMLNQLKSAAGADFDRRFIDQQTNTHQKALALLQDYLANGDSQPLKDFASKARTVVEGHFEHLNGIRK